MTKKIINRLVKNNCLNILDKNNILDVLRQPV